MNARDLLIALKLEILDVNPCLMIDSSGALVVHLADLPLPASTFENYVLEEADLVRAPSDVAIEIAQMRTARRRAGAR